MRRLVVLVVVAAQAQLLLLAVHLRMQAVVAASREATQTQLSRAQTTAGLVTVAVVARVGAQTQTFQAPAQEVQQRVLFLHKAQAVRTLHDYPTVARAVSVVVPQLLQAVLGASPEVEVEVAQG